VQVIASYYDFISAKYWDVKVKKIA
jgi:hypothetical protein